MADVALFSRQGTEFTVLLKGAADEVLARTPCLRNVRDGGSSSGLGRTLEEEGNNSLRGRERFSWGAK